MGMNGGGEDMGDEGSVTRWRSGMSRMSRMSGRSVRV
jgi:hypothetical protein